MSMAALRWARAARGTPSRPITPTQKHILLLLADSADDAHEAWPSALGLAADSGLTDRAVRTALAGLQAAGWIIGERAQGRQTRWKLPVGGFATSEGGSDDGSAQHRNVVPKRTRRTSERPTEVAPAEHRNVVPPHRNVVPPTSERRSATSEAGSDKPSRTPIEPSGTVGERARAVRLPDDWRPSAAGEGFCREQGLHLRNTFEAFGDYHRSKGSTFRDWDAAWRTWCRNEVKFSAGRGGSTGSRRKTPSELLAELDAERAGQPFDFDVEQHEPRFVPSTILHGRPH